MWVRVTYSSSANTGAGNVRRPPAAHGEAAPERIGAAYGDVTRRGGVPKAFPLSFTIVIPDITGLQPPVVDSSLRRREEPCFAARDDTVDA